MGVVDGDGDMFFEAPVVCVLMRCALRRWLLLRELLLQCCSPSARSLLRRRRDVGSLHIEGCGSF